MTIAPAPDAFRVVPAGDAAVMLQFPDRIDPAINARAMAVAASLRERWAAILRDVVIGYCTVTVYFDPLRVDARWLEAELQATASDVREENASGGSVLEVPVCYEGELAPDLPDVARYGGCTPEEVVALHSAGPYRVYMIGFVPGFAYLAEVDSRIAAPRRPTPRPAVPAGSVGIAGAQTGIYPAVTPGGWNIIGRTAVAPYDPAGGQPLLLQPGDTVRFVPVSRSELDERRPGQRSSREEDAPR